MATSADFRVGNGGSVIHLAFKQGNQAFSLVGATSVKILVKKKDGTVVVKDATIEDVSGSGADGKIKYIFTIDDLDQDGTWSVQGFARFSETVQVYTSIVPVVVGANLTEVPEDP